MAACMVGVLARFLATQLAIQATDAIDDPVDQPTMMVNSTSLCNVHKEKLDATLEHVCLIFVRVNESAHHANKQLSTHVLA